jgi:23S rRNA pseudouridine2605 synthase
MEGTRLNKFLASGGFGSRRSCEELIRGGRVRINGHVVMELATLVRGGDDVRVGNRACRAPTQRVVLAMNKPKGVICSRTDVENRKTVFDLLPPGQPRLFYVGRLDYDSEGLLILTNDGDLANELAHPSRKVPKVYLVGIDRPLEPVDAERLKRGVMTEFGFGRFDEVRSVGPRELRVVLSQGIKRQIRLMLQRLAYKVTLLRRIQIGGFRLDKLRTGQVRKLTEREIAQLRTAG